MRPMKPSERMREGWLALVIGLVLLIAAGGVWILLRENNPGINAGVVLVLAILGVGFVRQFFRSEV
jgi:hypothetical protein